MARIHSIVTITHGGILYKDIAEIARWIDFAFCQENYSSNYNGKDEQSYIGRMSYERASLAYIEFYTEAITRLEFENPQELKDLFAEIQALGRWHILNLDE